MTKESKRGGARPGAGRPAPPPAVVAEGVRLTRELGSSVEAARRLAAGGHEVDASRVRAWERAAREGAKEEPTPPAAPPAPRTVEPMPKGLTGREADLWIVNQEIEAVRQQLAQARLEKATNTAPLGRELRALLNDRAELSPPEAADPQAEERRWREEAARVRARIEAGCRAFEEG